MSKSSKIAQENHAQLLKRLEAEKRARNISVPTSIEDVIIYLRNLGQPITLFGERVADRRERLRDILSRLELEGGENSLMNRVLRVIAQSLSNDKQI